MITKINNAFSKFLIFQVVAFIVGVYFVLFTEGWGYVCALFVQTITTIVFEIITSNMLDRVLFEIYPQAKKEIDNMINAGAATYRSNFDFYFYSKAKHKNDKVVSAVICKKYLVFIACVVIDIMLVGLASFCL